MNKTEKNEEQRGIRSNDWLGADLIKAERDRQISEEGWTPEHDDVNTKNEMISAAVCYCIQGKAISSGYHGEEVINLKMMVKIFGGWPWAKVWWKPSEEPIRNLVKAGALIAAEIDRLNREKAKAPNSVLNEPRSDNS